MSSDQLPDQDRTPASVLKAMAENEAAYPKDSCTECGVTLRLGFFFDGFGRNKDLDKENPTFLSNVSRLWMAHYNAGNKPVTSKQRWYGFYYSGLGVDLNEGAKEQILVSALTLAGGKMADKAVSSVQDAAKNITRLDEVPDVDATGRAKKAVQQSIKDGSFHPMVKAYKDVVKDVQTLPEKTVRIWNALDPDRIRNRAQATLRGFWSDFKKNPLKVAWTAGKNAAKATLLEGVPVVRDNAVVAELMGTGVDTRLDAARRQFEQAYQAENAGTEKVVRIEVCVFGADRGGVIAKQFVNDIVKKYKRRHDTDLAIIGKDGAPDAKIVIRFLGLFDSVASIMEESWFLEFIPFTDLIKQTHKDRTLTIPAAVEKAVHFAAAHELRRNQRLDSLEKTRGLQYLYPGSSGDVTGVAPLGSLGTRASLSRVPLREMMNLALAHGAAMHSMESLAVRDLALYQMLSLADSIEDEGQTYHVQELVDAYREIVKYEPGCDFVPHMEVFLRWLAVRYQDPVFRAGMSDPAEQWIKDRDFFTPEQELAQERRRLGMLSREELAKPETTARARELEALANERRERANASRGEAPPQRFLPLWERLEEEYKGLEEAERQDAATEQRRQDMERNQPEQLRAIERWDQDAVFRENMRLGRRPGDPDYVEKLPDPFADKKADRAMQRRLLTAWRDARDGKTQLPPKVMTLFDWLVHDAMLSSWPDHLLASTRMYFRVRDKDVFAKTDAKAEMEQRAKDMRNAEKVEAMAARNEQNIRQMTPARP
ncbi:phospholipase effector Tle1 domain-containing protein [Achromobacter spanius]|uniref:phospholipase effector Tle1 domain-containing protein n=1 Tax=Achromobacter spanius TaxID=217203 RepID=UPI0032081B5D